MSRTSDSKRLKLNRSKLVMVGLTKWLHIGKSIKEVFVVEVRLYFDSYTKKTDKLIFVLNQRVN